MELWIIAVTVVVNGAVTWGVVSTKLTYMSRDIEKAHTRIDRLDDRIMDMKGA